MKFKKGATKVVVPFLKYNIVERLKKIIQYDLEDDIYVIKDVYKNNDIFVSGSLKVKLNEIFR
ncbi:MAG: hypothetical protein ACRC28_00775 [Clostridium sp.]|uniref:hypothetical protein n=1 Tax=Clostridium sp. TaxID=1506 RepID=UPI003F3EA0B3